MAAGIPGYEQQLLGTVEAIHAAVTNDVSWVRVMELLCDFVGARAADLNVVDSVLMQQMAYYHGRIDPWVVQRYLEEFVNDTVYGNPRVSTIYLPMVEGRVMADSDVWRADEMRAIPFFSGLMHPWGTWDSLHAWVRRTDDRRPWVALAIHYARAHCPPSAEHRRRVALLLPHLRRACNVQDVLAATQRHSSDLATTLDAMKEAAALVDRAARVVHANAAAHKVLAAGGGIRLDVRDVLTVDAAEPRTQLHAALAQCLSTIALLDRAMPPPVARIVVERPGRSPVVLTVQPLGRGQRERAAAVAMVFLATIEPATSDKLDSLRAAYGLTGTELQVVDALMLGKSLKQMAAERSISYETARTHMRNILSKTGAGRQSALLALLRSLN